MKSFFFLFGSLLLFSCGGKTPINEPKDPLDTSGDVIVHGTPDSNNIPAAPADCDLIRKILQLQRQEVRNSTGINADVAFTTADLQRFRDEGRLAIIVQSLRNDAGFTCVINGLRNMSPQNRTHMLDSATNTYRLAWAKLRMDPNTAPQDQLLRGQTAAGEEAEKAIAKSVVDLANDMLRR
jgi:hypothetical protein